ncbi:MAG: site-specific integrase [Candidatus Phosphoribacter sp.]
MAEHFADLQACDRSSVTLRSYGMDLLRWFRFLWAAEVGWDRATRQEARDFMRWMSLSGIPSRPHWRSAGVDAPWMPARSYSVAARAHCETVVRGFYSFHMDVGTGPLLNPFPLDRTRRGQRPGAHQNPMEQPGNIRTGLYRRSPTGRIPKSVPDAEFNRIFARLPSHRDRALVAFYVSTGARASELLGVTLGDVDPGRGVITVTRKGTRARQELPASSDAFVWLRLYQVEMGARIPKGRQQPLWWTLRSPTRPLTYPATHRMFERVTTRAGSGATLHSLRHTAAYRMAADPALPLTDVQFVLGHALLSTTQIYLTPRQQDVIARVLAHHAEQTRRLTADQPRLADGYRPETMATLFGARRPT